jgi:hypothetical protein
MPTRREFIQAGLAASVAPVAGPLTAATSGSSRFAIVPEPHRLYGLVCDGRSEWSTALAREAERLGIRVVKTSGDITDFWFNDLSLRWKASPVAIGGITGRGPLFCLERLGWDHGLRVVFRGTHRVIDRSIVEHVIDGPFPTIAAAHTGLAGADWPGRLAQLLNSCPAAVDTSSTTIRGAVPGDEPRGLAEAGHHEDGLMSWVIAPRVVRV